MEGYCLRYIDTRVTGRLSIQEIRRRGGKDEENEQVVWRHFRTITSPFLKLEDEQVEGTRKRNDAGGE